MGISGYREKLLSLLSVQFVLALTIHVLWPAAVHAWPVIPYSGFNHNHINRSIESTQGTDSFYAGWIHELGLLPVIDQLIHPPLPTTVSSMQNRTLLFNDDFDGPSLDSGKWNTHYWWREDDGGCTIAPNNELEWYQPDDVLVTDGILRLRAQERTVTSSNGTVYNYTSGVVTTGKECWDSPEPDRFAFLYGYAEARLRIPEGQGFWPAFWMLSCDQEWPPEIDIMEMVGSDTDNATMTVHYLDDEGVHRSQGIEWVGPDFSEDWHTFSVDWRPDAIIWYIDGIERWRYTDAANISAEPMYLVLNLAVGGEYVGPPDESTQFPNHFEIDYVRVWSPEVIDPSTLEDQVYLPMISK